VDAAEGAPVLAYTPRGEIVGCGTVGPGGLLPYLRVYGAEGDAPGMQAGERVRLVADGRELGALTWRNDWDTHELGDPVEGLLRAWLPLLSR
jgi:hypothetical protein